MKQIKIIASTKANVYHWQGCIGGGGKGQDMLVCMYGKGHVQSVG